ncbi:MAG: MBOAT family protein [Pseudomonadota bacterium]
MVFSSPIFLFGFLPCFLAAYYLVPGRWRSWLILLASALFYAWWRADVLLIVLAMGLASYAAAHGALRLPTERTRRWAVRLGVGFNLAVLGWFKYAMFVGGIVSDGTERAGLGALSVPDIILPIGLSFLTFQSISYIVDVARGDAPPARRLSDFMAFTTLFPQLIAGPVLRYKDIAAQFDERDHSVARVVAGLKRFIAGLAMKLLIADSVAPLADRLFALSHPTAAEAWLAALAYSIQLFFDFAGYSAMAIGLGLMIGFRFVENFDAPYTARSITEFWRRWHISLSRWLRDYLYVPLGGNRGGAPRTYRNLILTMGLGGLWHGANWTFLLWGLWHGGLMALERALGAKHRPTVWPRALAWPLTMVLVMIGWVMFRAETVGHAFAVYGGMAGRNQWAMRPEMLTLTKPSELTFLMLGLVLCAAPLMRRPPSRQRARLPLPSARLRHVASGVGATALLGLCALVVQARTDAPFLYFQF